MVALGNFLKKYKNLSEKAQKTGHYFDRHFVLRLGQLKNAWTFLLLAAFFLSLITFGLVHQINGLRAYYSQTVPATGGVYVEGLVGQLTTLNPIYASTEADKLASRLLFASLYKYDDQGQLQPDLAANFSWPDSNQGRFLVKLKPDLFWSDGQPLTAADIVFTIETIKNPAAGSDQRLAYQELTIRQIDQLTVEFSFEKTFAPFANWLTFGVLPKHSLATILPEKLAAAEFSQKPVGSGPFVFERLKFLLDPKSNRPELRLELLKNNLYHQPGQPVTEGFVLWLVADQKRLIDLFKSRQITGSASLPSKVSENQLVVDQKVSLSQLAGVYLFFKTDQAPLNNQALRQALAASLNQEKIIEELDGRQVGLDGPILPTNLGYLPAANPNQTNLEETLLSLGYRLETGGYWQKEGQTLSLQISTLEKTIYEDVARLVKDQLEKKSIRVDLKFWPAEEFEKSVLNNHNYGQGLIYGLGIGFDPDVFIFWHSSQIGPQSLWRLNLSNYSSALADQYLGQGRQELNKEKRAEIYQQFQTVWRQDVPAVPLYQPQLVYHFQAGVVGPKSQVVADLADFFNQVGGWSVAEKSIWRPVKNDLRVNF